MSFSSFQLNLVAGCHDFSTGERGWLDAIGEAVNGGVTLVQLREKNLEGRDFLERARMLKKNLIPKGVKLIINDRVDIALAARADGVHVGQSDIPFAEARALMGVHSLVGLSVETVEQARQAEILDVDYLGVGPIFLTKTKLDAAPSIGIEGLKKIVAFSRHYLMAIGGLKVAHIGELIRAGAHGVAVVSAITQAKNPRQAAQDFRSEIEKHRKKIEK